MSNYFTAIAIFTVMALPLAIPVTVTLVHAIRNVAVKRPAIARVSTVRRLALRPAV